MNRVSTVLIFGCFATISACSEGQHGVFAPVSPDPWGPLEVKSEPEFFKSCGELREWIETSKTQVRCGNDMLLMTAEPSAAVNGTNVQVDGVDEPDFVKVDSRNLYVAREKSVEAISLQNPRRAATLEFPDGESLTLLNAREGLIVLSQERKRFVVHLYEAKARSLKARYTFNGQLKAARLAGSDLLLVGVQQTDVNLENIECSAVQRPIANDRDAGLLSIYRIDVTGRGDVRSAHRIGAAQDVYVSTKNIYFMKAIMGNELVAQFSWREEAGPRYLASGVAPGYAPNGLAFHEREDGAAFLVTGTSEANRVWSFARTGYDLLPVAHSEAFGENEGVRAVRFMEGRVYVVTYRYRDPLYVFDLERLSRLSRLEVPGFSAYLHPLRGDRLLGVGFGDLTRGVQLSVFDKADPMNIKVLSQKTFGDWSSAAPAATDHHAFAYDSDSDTAAVPIQILRGYDHREFSGAYIIQPSRGVEPVAVVSHWDLVPETCRGRPWGAFDIQRMIKVHGAWISVSPFGIRFHDDATLATRVSRPASDPERICNRLFGQFPGPGGGI